MCWYAVNVALLQPSALRLQAFSATQATLSIARWGGLPPSADALPGTSPSKPSAGKKHSRLLRHVPSLGTAVSHSVAEEASRELFNHLDVDGNGTISLDELRELHADLGEAWPAEQAERFVSEHQLGDGITFAQFWALQQQLLGMRASVPLLPSAASPPASAAATPTTAAARQRRLHFCAPPSLQPFPCSLVRAGPVRATSIQLSPSMYRRSSCRERQMHARCAAAVMGGHSHGGRCVCHVF